MMLNNIFELIPDAIDSEITDILVNSDGVRIERILSQGQCSPAGADDWYDQSDNEWVIVLKGAGVITWLDGSQVRLNAGDFLNIPAHKKHKVSWTDPDEVTLWLAIFYH